jgi:ferric-dicitrate binding protein FerR (iron transport regulator)
MKALSDKIAQLAFGKSDDVPLTSDEKEICEEWTSGKASENMKIDAADPRLLEYVGLYDKLDSKKDEIWESIEATHSLTQPAEPELPTIQQPTHRIGKRTWMLAAAVLTTSIVGVYALYQFINTSKNSSLPTQQTSPVVKRAIEPGRARAVLTLADNSQIDLDTQPAGVIAHQDQMQISKQKDNQLVYSIANNQKTGVQVLNNSLTTPYGGEYKVTLADGSKVWLNAGSSLKYPTAFTSTDRVVEITGEGYFEVAPDKTKPFRVFAHGTEVKVLGTKFNLKAYDADKQVTTTLVTGAVAIQHGSAAQHIKPNQQAVVVGDNIEIKDRSKEEMTRVLAWKNGLINLEGESVRSILQQIERWYNVDTHIEAGTPETTTILTGTIERSEPLDKVLDLLNTNLSVQFKLQDHTVVAREKAN